jgi:hypothetical protein
MEGPNPISALISMLGARRLRPPDPTGIGGSDAEGFDEVLTAVASGGVPAIPAGPLSDYLDSMAAVDPDTLSRDGALAHWLNLYNAGALDLARRAFDADLQTVLQMPGVFGRPFIEVAGENLSLDGIEHGKIRRFGDPRIHSALVCGSVSCPMLRHEAYREDALDGQLDDQMRTFLASGGALVDVGREVIGLSRVFRWYGGDFVRPHAMPTLRLAGSAAVLVSISPWLPPDLAEWVLATSPSVEFQEYDWALGCSINRPA